MWMSNSEPIDIDPAVAISIFIAGIFGVVALIIGDKLNNLANRKGFPTYRAYREFIRKQRSN